MDYGAHGRYQSLRVLGLTKYARVDKVTQTESDTAYAPAVAAGAAAASPFLGLIGEKPIIHDPYANLDIPRVKDVAEFNQQLRPGDVLLTSKDTGSLWKQTVAPFAGSEFYHTQPVIGSGGITASAGQFHDGVSKPVPVTKETAASRLANARKWSRTTEELANRYKDMMVLRPKNVTPQQAEAMAQVNAVRSTMPYDTKNALKGWFNDLMMPKTEGRAAQSILSDCVGGICSSVPAQALKDVTGKDVVPGKPAHLVMPPDFLRSTEYEPVAVMLNSERKKALLSPTARKMMSRAGVGAGLAAATYGAVDTPEALAVPAGAAGGYALGQALPGAEKAPGFLSWFESRMSPEAFKPDELKKLRSSFRNRKAIPAAVGGALGLAGALGLNSLRPKRE